MKRHSLGLLLLLSAFGLLLAACQATDAVEITAVLSTPFPSPIPIVMVTETAVSTPTLAQPKPEATPIPVPKITKRSPRNLMGERRPLIQLTFNQPMDRDSVAAALQSEPALDFDLSWDGDVLTIEPATALEPDTYYYLTVEDTAVSQYNIPLSQPYQWELYIRRLISRVEAPRDSRRDPLVIHFNYAMDDASVRRAFTTQPAIVGDLTWNDDFTTCTFTPAAPLPVDTEFSVNFDDPILDADGDPFLEPAPFQFATLPPILRHQPDTPFASPTTSIEATFDRLMDEGATNAVFAIHPDIPGRITWRETTLVFTPDPGAIAENTEYTVTIGAGATGADGELILEEDYIWSFTTREMPDIASFGYGPNAQVVDANGRRAIQFVSTGSQTDELVYELYQLNTEQFLDRYASGFRGTWEEGDPISTEGAALVKQWPADPDVVRHSVQGVHELIIPDDVPPGLYILNMTARHLNDQLILILSANTIIVKQAEEQITAWVTDINGGPRPDVDVAVYARDGEMLANGRTDANGIFRTTVDTDPQPLIVIARDGEDMIASGLSNEWRNRNNQWWGWWQSAPAARDYVAYIYTDRPIYRPGQLVFYKAILRRDDDAVLDILPAGTPATVRIRDARNNVVQTVELITNDFGTIDGQFQLAEGVTLGDYAVEVVLDGESHRQTFKVEDYRKPDYQVTVTTNGDRFVAGDEIEVTVDTAYFFGEPVPDAAIVVNQFMLRERYWYDESDDEYIWYQSYERPINGRTDENGRFTFTIDAQAGELESDWRSSVKRGLRAIEATVDDGSHQTVSGFAMVEIFNAAEKLTLETNGYAHEPDKPFSIQANVQTIFDEPVNGRAVSLTLRRWTSVGYDYNIVIQTAHMTVGENGRADLTFSIEEPGFYQLRATMRDGRGHEISYKTYVYAFSERFSHWYGRSDNLHINADQDSYAPGDIAQLIIESSVSGPALLTFERGTTRREQLIELTAPVTMVDVPIQPDDAPNIYVTVNAWHEQDTTLTEEGDYFYSKADSRLHTASVNLSVPVTDKTLLVTITPDKSDYAPRDEAVFTVRVTNQAGVPVSAELSLALVDEAIFAFSDELSGPISDAFYFERSNIVRTYDALALQRWLLGGGGGGGGGGDLAGNPRSDFPDTAVWFPALHTDHNGEAEIRVALPDNLTSWRLTAKAVTADTQVGETFINMTTHQDIVVRPILPRALTAGDQVNLSAIIHNYSDDTQTIDVSLVHNSQFIIHNSQLTHTITLSPGALQLIGWPVMAVAAGESPILIEAWIGERVGDAVEVPLVVRPLAIPDVTTQVGQFSGELSTEVDLPADALSMSSVRIELSRSIAGTLLEGLEYLTGFPYGCVEQTMSRALPNAVVGRALFQLGVTNPTLQADLPAKINASLQRLYGFQHNDGGWGWWFDDRSHDYQTAWVIFGLATMADAGYEVDPSVIERGVNWLNEHLSGMDIRTRAYALYSMAVAGQPNQEATLALLAELDELDTFSRAGLALALWDVDERDAARAIVDELAETAVIHDDGKVYWPSEVSDGYYRNKTMASSTRSAALALSAFVKIRPHHELEPGIARWLMSQRQRQGWGTTNETSYAILALTDHLLATSFSEAATATSYTVWLNGTAVAGGNLGRGEPAVSIEIPAEQMEVGGNELRITHDGRRLYYAVNKRVYLAQEEIEAAGVVAIERKYLGGTANRTPDTFTPGQLIRVRLTVYVPNNASYVIVEDQLPGGLEALNEGLNTTSRVAQTYEEPRSYWREVGYNYKEIRGDRVSFFITEMDAGTHAFTYFARVTHSGDFTAMPTEAYAMYDLTTWGRSASSKMVVSE
ncbi:MAG: hypothetical protein GY803_13440 [Chloroflexi bacterium]|nr:hypothetical protein [Chloroflexota bacterium]